MVKVTIGGISQLKGSEADIVQSLVVDTESLVSVFHELMNGECGVVGLNNSIRDL